MSTSAEKRRAGKTKRNLNGDRAKDLRESARPRAVVLTALPGGYAAVRSHLSDLQEQIHEQGTIYETGAFLDGQPWDVAVVEIGAGNVKTAAEAERAMQHFRPRVLLFVGVGGGLKDVLIGDVVIATKIYGYESGKAESEFHPRPQVFAPSYRLEQRARAEARKTDWLQRVKASPSESNPRVFLGPIAAGEAVVASRASAVSQFIQENYGDSLAVEMEGRGLLEAASINEQVDALVIRGISDLLDRKTESDAQGSQEVAAAHAAAFAFELLANIGPTTLPLASAGDLWEHPPAYPPAQAEAGVRTVDVGGKGQHRTIGEAIEAATPGERILIKPGLYEEAILVSKVVELVGDGKQDDVVVQCNKISCLSFQATLGRVSNITFRQLGDTEEPCVDIKQGRLELETCTVSSQGASGVAIRNAADPRIRYCNIHDNKKGGVVVSADGVGTLEENTLFHNGGSGLEITAGGSPTVRSNVIRDNRGAGVDAHDQGTGVLDGNDIFGNDTGVSVSVGSKLTILRNSIHDNASAGVEISGKAEAVVESSAIIGNETGIEVVDGSQATIRESKVRAAAWSGIDVRGHSHAVIERNQISGHSYWGIKVDDQSTASIRKNQVHSCSASGIRVAGKSSANVDGNRLYKNHQCGMDVGESKDVVVRGNRIVRNAGVGVQADNAKDFTLENNDLRGNRAAKLFSNMGRRFESGNKE